ncbi:carboxypeptidase Q-like isoform X2 [Cylas formicarius]|nr:carboxypeptidase Q-like isoform X2 [Cylas formicarius]
MRKNDLENVNGEEVTVTRWNRLLEAGELTEPRSKSIALTALGSSVSTPVGGLEAEVAVVRSFAELDRGNFTGKIVVINQEFNGYDHDYMYRSNGATEASKKGAVAALVRALTPFSMYGLYTGQQTYRNNVTKIPAASITKEDAQMMQRMQDRGERIVMRLQISTESLDNSTSRNAVGEVVGLTEPNKVVVVSAHTDSWDVGLGAMDDGGGVFMSVYSLVVLKALGLRPRRTLRTILFTGEEQCYCGVNDYNEAHLDELDDFVFVMESDEGTWNPLGLSYTAGTRGGCVLQEILKLLAPLNATKAVRVDNVGSDISLWTKSLLPGASLLNENDRWYWFQHNEADTMDVMDRDAMDKATAVWTSVAYVIADLRLEFPKERD